MLDVGPGPARPRRAPLFDLAPGLLGIWADYFGLGVIVPLLPRWCRRVARVSDQWVGFILTGQYCAVVLGQLVVGVAADRIGRHRTMAAVMAGDAALFVASGLIDRAAPQLLARVAVGLCAPPALAVAWVAEASPAEDLPRAMGLIAASIHSAILLGAVFGGLLGARRWLEANLVAAAVPALNLALVGAHARRRRPPPRPSPSEAAADPASPPLKAEAEAASASAPAAPPSRAPLRSVLVSRPFGAVGFAMLANGLGLSAQFSLVPVALARDHGFSEAALACALMPAAFCQIFNHACLLPRLIRRLGAWRAAAALHLALGALYGALVARPARARVAPLLVASTLSYWTVSFSQGVANFLATTVATERSAAGARAAIGTVNGVARSLFNVGFGLGPVCLLQLARVAEWLPYAVLAAACFASAAVSWCVVWDRATPEKPP